MTRIIMIGCNGHMGQVISDLVAADEDAVIVAGVDIIEAKNDYPVYAKLADVAEEADAIEKAVNKALDDGYRTSDIYKDGFKKVGCSEMGTIIASNI